MEHTTLTNPDTLGLCQKSFKKTENILHYLHNFHTVFGIVIWIIIVILLIDYYKHILPHSSHEGILWFEFICYTSFLAIPVIIGRYREYKIKNCLINIENEKSQ